MGCAAAATGTPDVLETVNLGELARRTSLLLGTSALTALVEELIFRGLLLGTLLCIAEAAGGLTPARVLAAVLASAAVFAALHGLPAPGEPWPQPGVEATAVAIKILQALLFGIAVAAIRLGAGHRTWDGSACSADGPGASRRAVDSASCQVPGLALDPVLAAGWHGGLRGLGAAVAIHFAFDGLYFAPVVLATGAFPVTYICGMPSEWAALIGSSVVLLWAAAWAVRLVVGGVLPYDDGQRGSCR